MADNQQNQRQPQGEQVIFIAPPTGGLNLHDNPLTLSPQFASEYVNFMPPTGSGIMVRPGIEVVIELDGIITCMYSYIVPASSVYNGNPNDSTLTTPQVTTLLVKIQTPNKVNFLYEVNPYANPAAFVKKSDITNSEFATDSVIFMDSLFFLTGDPNESPYIYSWKRNTSSLIWHAPTTPSDNPKEPSKILSGELLNNINSMTIYKNILYGSQKGTLNIFHILARNVDLNNVANYSSKDFQGAYNLVSMGWFSLMGVITRGGDILKMFTFGSGRQGQEQDLLCVLTTNGELLVYDGESPNNLDTWKLSGHYYLPAPLNLNCISSVEDDYIIVTANGFISLRSILTGTPGRLDDALTNRLSTLFGEYQFRLPSFTNKMFLQYYPKRRVVIFNVPTDMPLKLYEVLEGYEFDEKTLFTFAQEVSTVDYKNSIINFLAYYILSSGVNYTVDFFLDKNRVNKIEMLFTCDNIILSSSSKLSVDVTIKLGVHVYNENTKVIDYFPWVDPIVYRCSDVLQSISVIADTTTIISGTADWSSSIDSIVSTINGEDIRVRSAPLNPIAIEPYEYDITDVFAFTQSLLNLRRFSIITFITLPLASQNYLLTKAFRVAVYPKNWEYPVVPQLSIVSLVDIPKISSDIDYSKVIVDGKTLALPLVRLGQLVESIPDSIINNGYLMGINFERDEDEGTGTVRFYFVKSTELGPYTATCLLRAPLDLKVVVEDEEKDIIWPTIYYANKPVNSAEWTWEDITDHTEYPPVALPLHYNSKPRYMVNDTDSSISVVPQVKQLLDRVLLTYSEDTSEMPKKLVDYLQVWFTPSEFTLSTGTILNPRPPHRGRYWGSDKLIIQIMQNAFNKYFLANGFSVAADRLGNGESKCVSAKCNFKLKQIALIQLDMPIELVVYIKNNNSAVSDRMQAIFVLYIGAYENTAMGKTGQDFVNALTDFNTKPAYCVKVTYQIDRWGNLDYPSRIFEEVVSTSESVSRIVTGTTVEDISCNVGVYKSYPDTTVSDAEDIFVGLFTGDLYNAPMEDKKLWIQQFGWLYSVINFIMVGDTEDYQNNEIVSNTDTSMVPFLNMINIEKEYTSTQYVLDVQRGTWAQWKDVNMVSAVEHNSDFFFVRIKEELDRAQGSYQIKKSQICKFNSEQDGDFDNATPIEAYYKTGFTDLGAQNLKKFTKCKIFATASTFWTAYPYDLYYAIDFENQTPVRYSGETIEAHLRKPKALQAKPKTGRTLTHKEFREQKAYLKEYANLSSNVKWVNMMTIATQGTRIALGSRFYITEHNVIVWGYEVHFVPLSSY
jgi:hypothetical protein